MMDPISQQRLTGIVDVDGQESHYAVDAMPSGIKTKLSIDRDDFVAGSISRSKNRYAPDHAKIMVDSDWYHNSPDLAAIFESGGYIVTRRFRLSEQEEERVCLNDSDLTVLTRADGNPSYYHGFHDWQNQGWLVTARGVKVNYKVVASGKFYTMIALGRASDAHPCGDVLRSGVSKNSAHAAIHAFRPPFFVDHISKSLVDTTTLVNLVSLPIAMKALGQLRGEHTTEDIDRALRHHAPDADDHQRSAIMWYVKQHNGYELSVWDRLWLKCRRFPNVNWSDKPEWGPEGQLEPGVHVHAVADMEEPPQGPASIRGDPRGCEEAGLSPDVTSGSAAGDVSGDDGGIRVPERTNKPPATCDTQGAASGSDNVGPSSGILPTPFARPKSRGPTPGGKRNDVATGGGSVARKANAGQGKAHAGNRPQAGR